jgi:hypothetical protein
MVRILLPSSEESPANLTQTTREEELEDAYERGAAEPILPLKLWRDRVIALGSSAGSRAAWGLARRLPVRHHADGRPARAERRYPGARIILAHAGGFLPYASHRFAELARVFRPDALKPADILASFKRFYFDTALSSGPRLCRACRAFAGHGRILFGSDFPYAPVGVAASFTHGCRDHRDRISISRFLDRGAVGQYVKPGKTEDLDARLDSVRRPRGALEAPANRTGTARIARRTIRRAELIVLTHTMASASL